MARERQFNEQEVIQRFTDVFWKKGYNACSVGDLIAASGLSRSSLYDTFGDKEQLFIRCLEFYGAYVQENLLEGTKDLTDPLEKIETALLMPFSKNDKSGSCRGCMAVNTMGELDGTSNEVKQLILNTRKGFEDFIADCIREGQASGAIATEENPDSLASLLYTLLCGLLILQKASPNQALLQQNVRLALMLLN